MLGLILLATLPLLRATENGRPWTVDGTINFTPCHVCVNEVGT